MEGNKTQIDISVLKGDKLFNENTPFVINISSPQPEIDDKKCNADLICVIDISGSMMGEKIELVKESLKILIGMMDKNDRLALILFDNNSQVFFDLNYLTDKTKKELTNQINSIKAHGGTNILSGLQLAVNILKKEKDNTKNENRVSSVILLSDGCDNYSDDIQLGESLKNLTKGLGLSFTLHTFGYGQDHDPKTMNKLANIRDGSFFLVEDYNKVAEYFVTVLGGCVSVISKKVDLSVTLLNDKCKIIKIFGEDNLYSHELKPLYFKTSMLQFICGKEYTFVLELKIDDANINPGDELLEVELDDIEYKIYEKERFMYPVPACMCDIRFIDSDVVETYELSGIVSDLGLATIICKKHKAADFEYLEKIYRGSKKFLATTAEYKKNKRIEFDYDKEKVKVIKNNL